jgi:hypothetical protein
MSDNDKTVYIKELALDNFWVLVFGTSWIDPGWERNHCWLTKLQRLF